MPKYEVLVEYTVVYQRVVTVDGPALNVASRARRAAGYPDAVGPGVSLLDLESLEENGWEFTEDRMAPLDIKEIP